MPFLQDVNPVTDLTKPVDNQQEQETLSVDVSNSPYANRKLPKLPEDMDFSDKVAMNFDAAMKGENIVYNALEYINRPRTEIDENFDPLSLVKGTDYESYAYAFAKARNQQDFDRIMAEVDNKHLSQELWSQEGWTGPITQIIAGNIDPLILAAPLRGVSASIKGARGIQALKAAGITASEAAILATGYEAALGQIQESRTMAESVQNVMATAIFGGVLGGAARGILPDKQAMMINKLAEGINEAQAIDILENLPEQMVPKSAGAAARDITAEELMKEIEGDKVAGMLGKGGAYLGDKLRLSPLLRGLNSESKTMRETIQEMVRTPLRLQKNEYGIATSQAVTQDVQRLQGELLIKVREYDEIFSEFDYKKYNIPRSQAKKEFDNRVAESLFRDEPSVYPEVNRAAGKMTEYFSLYETRLREAGALQDGVKINGKYIPHAWDQTKIRQNSQAFKQVLKKHFQRAIQDEVELDKILEDTMNNILGIRTDIRIEAAADRLGNLKERTLDIPYDQAKRFLVHDPDLLMKRYFKSVAPQYAIINKFGDLKMSQPIAAIQADYEDMIKKTEDPLKREKLYKKMEKDIKLIQNLRDIELGVYKGLPLGETSQRYLRAWKSWNSMTFMGQAMVSSVADMARPILRFGITSVFKDALVPFVKDMVQNGLKIKSPSLAKYLGETSGAAVERIGLGRTGLMSDILEGEMLLSSRFDRALTKANNAFFRLSLLPWWNDMNKQFATFHVNNYIHRMLKKVVDGKGLKQNDIETLAEIGLGEREGRLIIEQIKKHGDYKNGVNDPGLEKWDNQPLADYYRNILNKVANESVLTPDAGSVPMFMQTPEGSAALQFKRFTIASYQSTMLRALQNPLKMATLNYLALSVGLAAMGNTLKNFLAGREQPNDVETMVIEAIDKAGVLSILADVNNVFEDAYGIGMRSLGTDETRSMIYREQGDHMSTMGNIFLPASRGSQLMELVTGNASEKKSAQIMRQMIPFNNLFWLRSMFDIGQDVTTESLGGRAKERIYEMPDFED